MFICGRHTAGRAAMLLVVLHGSSPWAPGAASVSMLLSTDMECTWMNMTLKGELLGTQCMFACNTVHLRRTQHCHGGMKQ